jgi:hypothetical protein
MFPKKKQAKASVQACLETDWMSWRVGNEEGKVESVTGGNGPLNCLAERRKRYIAMGSHMIGTMYQCVFVKTSR